MKQFLQKVLEILRMIWRVTLDLIGRLVEVLRAVDVDAPRAVMLCIALQLVIAVGVIVAFRNETGTPARALPGQIPADAEPEPLPPR